MPSFPSQLKALERRISEKMTRHRADNDIEHDDFTERLDEHDKLLAKLREDVSFLLQIVRDKGP